MKESSDNQLETKTLLEKDKVVDSFKVPASREGLQETDTRDCDGRGRDKKELVQKDEQRDIVRFEPSAHKTFKAPHTFHLPEMVSYCLSSDLSTLLYCSSNAETVLGCPINHVKANGGILLRHVHFDDRFRVLNSLEDALLLKKPVLVSYRWTPPNEAAPTVLVNHCVAADSDFGKVISGVIFRINPSLSEELSILSDHSSTAHGGGNQRGLVSEMSLTEELKPFGNSLRESPEGGSFKKVSRRCIPFVEMEAEHSMLLSLFEDLKSLDDGKKNSREELSRERNAAGQYLFHQGRVYLAELSRVERDTFSPHLHFSLRDTTEEFLQEQELKSLRRIKSSMTTSGVALSELEGKLEGLLTALKSTASQSPKESTPLSAQIEDCLEQFRCVRTVFSKAASSPFISGRELLLQSVAPIAAEIPSDVEMSVVLADPGLYLWRTVGDELKDFVKAFTKQMSQLAQSAEQLEIRLSSGQNHSISLLMIFQFPVSLKAEVSSAATRLNKRLSQGVKQSQGGKHLLSYAISQESQDFYTLLKTELHSAGALRSGERLLNHLK